MGNPGGGEGDGLKPRLSLASFSEHLFCNVKSGICRRNAAIDRRMQQEFLDLFAGYSIVGRSSQVKTEFIAAIQRHHHSHGDQAARSARQPRPGPYFSPSAAGDEVLERRVEFAFICLRAIHVGVAEHLAPYFYSGFVPFPVVHLYAPSRLENRSTTWLNSSLASRFERCAAFSSTYSARGMCSARYLASAKGMAGSCFPATMSVGTFTLARDARSSVSRTEAQHAA